MIFITTFFSLGEISINTQGKIDFKMTMKGMWKKAFDIDTLAIGNALLSISYTPGNPLPGFGNINH